MTILMTVNGEAVAVDGAVRRSILHDEEFLKNTIDFELLRQYAEQNNISNSDAELQVAADELRYHRGLEGVDSLNQWMRPTIRHCSRFRKASTGCCCATRSAAQSPTRKCAAYYAEHKSELEAVELYSFRARQRGQGRELRSQIVEEGANFHALAIEHSQDEQTGTKAATPGGCAVRR